MIIFSKTNKNNYCYEIEVEKTSGIALPVFIEWGKYKDLWELNITIFCFVIILSCEDANWYGG